MPATLDLDLRGAVAWLTLTGDGGHQLTLDLLTELESTLSDLADHDLARVAILTGADGVFCNGWDVLPSPHRDVAGGWGSPRHISAVFSRIAASPLPLIAAIDGDALDAGLELALVSDVRLTSERAHFGFPAGVTAGRLPLGGGAARLARAAGQGTAALLLLTGETLDAAGALACGLVSGVYPAERLAEEAERLAGVIASRGPIATRYAKEAVARGMEMPLDQALRHETDLTIILQSTADRAEGVRAFVEKREPRFTGQ